MEAGLTRTYSAFFESEKAGAALLLVCTPVAMAPANSAWRPAYQTFRELKVPGFSLQHRVNDALMGGFFWAILFASFAAGVAGVIWFLLAPRKAA